VFILAYVNWKGFVKNLTNLHQMLDKTAWGRWWCWYCSVADERGGRGSYVRLQWGRQ